MTIVTTPRWALRTPDSAQVADVPADLLRLASDLDNVAMDDQGMLANRPNSTAGTPGKRGRWYFATDTLQLFRDNGTGWDELIIGAPATPVGALVDYGGSADPADTRWMIANGRLLTRTTYPTLFTVIGTQHNIGGEAATDFRLPNPQGRSIVGAGTGSGLTARALAATGGEERHLLSAAESGQNGSATGGTNTTGLHQHNVHYNYGPAGGVANLPYFEQAGHQFDTYIPTDASGNHAHSVSMNGRTADQSHENMPPWLALNKLIRVR
jgi:microcystin-dependent protein